MFSETITTWIFIIIAFLVVISVHEAAHAWSAYIMGDDTAKRQGRLTLNPLKHLDPLGTIMIFIARFGWGKPVPVNPGKFRNPRMGYFLTSIAGPASNLILAAVLAIPVKYLLMDAQNPYLVGILTLFSITIYLSIFLMIFNLIPIAPLDGSKIWQLILPESKSHWLYEMEKNGPIILIGALLISNFLGLNLFAWISVVTESILGLLYFTT